jgi:hypothetical protein
LSEFLDVTLDVGLKFDVLLDGNNVIDDGSQISNNLVQTLRDYGAIVVKITDGVVDENVVKSFVDVLSRYTSATKNKIGLGLIIGEEISENAHMATKRVSSFRRGGINNLLLITKPSIPGVPR